MNGFNFKQHLIAAKFWHDFGFHSLKDEVNLDDKTACEVFVSKV